VGYDVLSPIGSLRRHVPVGSDYAEGALLLLRLTVVRIATHLCECACKVGFVVAPLKRSGDASAQSMNHAFRVAHYRKIEAERRTRVLLFVTGERAGLQTQIAGDAIGPFVSLLDQIGPTKKLSLILDTNGGQTSAAWRLINLIRSFGDELEIIIPTKAMSAGTLMSLGADRIVMTKQAALGPIDPSLPNHPLAPLSINLVGQQQRVPVSAEAVRGYIDEVRKGIQDPAALASVWINLASQVHPLVLGEIFRLGEQIRSLARMLIGRQVVDESKREQIIQLLCSDSGSHDYTINRRQATEMGLTIEKPSAETYGILREIAGSFASELKTFEPYSLRSLLGAQTQAPYTLIRGLIESADESFGFVTEGLVAVDPAKGLDVVNQPTFDGWRKL